MIIWDGTFIKNELLNTRPIQTNFKIAVRFVHKPELMIYVGN